MEAVASRDSLLDPVALDRFVAIAAAEPNATTAQSQGQSRG
jgi:hypothetical protein